MTKQLGDGFKRSFYWSNYQTISEKVRNNDTNIYELLSASFQGGRRLFVLGYDAIDDNEAAIKNNRKYFLATVKIENYNVLIDGKKIYDQTFNDLIKQYDKVRKVSSGQGDDYPTGCLLDLCIIRLRQLQTNCSWFK